MMVTLGGKIFSVTLVEQVNGIQRLELNRYGRVKPKREPPDLFIYSLPVTDDPKTQALRGVFIDEDLRGEGLLRPLLNLFFKTFPDVQRTHPNFVDPVTLDLLAAEYGFSPARDVAPNAFFGRVGQRSAIHFVDPRMMGRMANMLSQFEVVDWHLPSFRPLHLGEPLVLKDRGKFEWRVLPSAAEGASFEGSPQTAQAAATQA